MLDLKRYYFIPYNDKDHGWNGTHCWGFFRLFIKEEKGIDILDYRRDATDLFEHACEKAHEEYEVVEIEEIRPFDAILFNGITDIPVHIGISIGGGKFIHMLGNKGVSVMRVKDWHDRIVGIHRHKGLI